MYKYTRRFTKLMFGLFLYSFGIVMTMRANLGFAPWEVLHEGMAKISRFTIGETSIILGFVICILAVYLGEKLGLGTVLNMFLIGVFMDMIIGWDVIPKVESIFYGFVMLLLGLFVNALATYFYISSAFGAGPRDTLMVALEKRSGFSPGLSKAILEISAVLAGWSLGGPVGAGTVVAAFGLGIFIDFVFKLFAFDPSKIEHDSFLNLFKKVFDNI